MRQLGLWMLAVTLLSMAGAARAQSAPDGGPESGSHEIQFWAGGGHTIQAKVPSTGVWEAGARYGWVITDLHGPSFLRGRFEYAVDLIPVLGYAGPQQTAYGVSFDPIVLRWNFQQRRGIMPYMEVGGGTLFTNHSVPPGVDAVNFTPSGGIGVSVPRGRYRWSVELHYLHISDAGLTTYNPGTNTLGLRVGFGWYSKHRE